MTVRSAILGLLVVLAVVLEAPYSIWMVRSSEITWSYFPTSVGFCFAVIFLANTLVRRLCSKWALGPAELATILVMGLAATGIPTFIVGTMLAIISSPYYGASPENDWEASIHPYLPDWVVPRPDGDAMRWFYEGLPSGQGIPFGAWVGPLFWWGSLILTVYFVSFCLVVIFRRQWVEHERLVFPLMEMPRLLINDGGRGLLRSKSFWVGCSIPLGFLLFNIIGFFHIGFPQIHFDQAITIQFSREFPTIALMLYFPVIGFTYLVNTSVSFSICFFYLVAVLQEGITNRIGYDVTRPDAFVWGMQSLSWQAWGGFMAMALLSLWMGRPHLWAVCRQAFGGKQTIDDGTEMVSYRTAVYGLVIGLIYILAWLWKSGMDLHLAFGSWYFVAGGGAGGMAFDGVIRHFNDPWPTDWNKLLYFGIGMMIYWLLALCQYRFSWWPLHPVGITVAPLWMTRLIVFSVFLAWASKSAIMRYGGIRAYRSARPFFMGLVVGYFLGVGISYLVDTIWFLGTGHAYFHG